MSSVALVLSATPRCDSGRVIFGAGSGWTDQATSADGIVTRLAAAKSTLASGGKAASAADPPDWAAPSAARIFSFGSAVTWSISFSPFLTTIAMWVVSSILRGAAGWVDRIWSNGTVQTFWPVLRSTRYMFAISQPV